MRPRADPPPPPGPNLFSLMRVFDYFLSVCDDDSILLEVSPIACGPQAIQQAVPSTDSVNVVSLSAASPYLLLASGSPNSAPADPENVSLDSCLPEHPSTSTLPPPHSAIFHPYRLPPTHRLSRPPLDDASALWQLSLLLANPDFRAKPSRLPLEAILAVRAAFHQLTEPRTRQRQKQSLEAFVRKTAYLVFNLGEVADFEPRTLPWIHLCMVFEKVHSENWLFLRIAKAIYEAQQVEVRNFLIRNLLKWDAIPPSPSVLPSPSPSTAPATVDFVSRLPAEVAQRILCCLDAESVLRAAAVCCTWRRRALDLRLWRQICVQDGVRSLPAPNYKPRPDPFTPEGWLVPVGRRFAVSQDLEPPTRFYNVSTLMYDPPLDFFGLRWHGELQSRLEGQLPAEWLRHRSVLRRWTRGTETNVMRWTGGGVVDQAPVTCADFGQGLFVTGSLSGRLTILSSARGAVVLDQRNAHPGGVWALAIAPDGAAVFSGGADAHVKVWNAISGCLQATLARHTGLVRCLKAFDQHLVSAAQDGTLVLAPLHDLSRAVLLTGHKTAVRCLDAGGGFIVGGDYDGDISVWETDTTLLKGTLRGHRQKVTCMQLDVSTNRLVSGSTDASVRVWDLLAMSCVCELTGHFFHVNKVLLHEDFVFSASSDTTVKTWRISSGECVHSFHGHSYLVHSLRHLAPFGLLVSASEDGLVCLFNPISGHRHTDLFVPRPATRVSHVLGSPTQLAMALRVQNEVQLVVRDFDHPLP